MDQLATTANATAAEEGKEAVALLASVEAGQQDEVITREEVARRCHVCPSTVKNWELAGLVPHIVLGRSVRYLWPDVVSALRRRQRMRRVS